MIGTELRSEEQQKLKRRGMSDYVDSEREGGSAEQQRLLSKGS